MLNAGKCLISHTPSNFEIIFRLAGDDSDEEEEAPVMPRDILPVPHVDLPAHVRLGGDIVEVLVRRQAHRVILAMELEGGVPRPPAVADDNDAPAPEGWPPLWPVPIIARGWPDAVHVGGHADDDAEAEAGGVDVGCVDGDAQADSDMQVPQENLFPTASGTGLPNDPIVLDTPVSPCAGPSVPPRPHNSDSSPTPATKRRRTDQFHREG